MTTIVPKLKKRKKRRAKPRVKWYAISGLILLAIAGLVYGVLNAPVLKIEKVEAAGIVEYDSLRAEILKNNLAKFFGFNHFFSWPRKVGNTLIKKDYLKRTLILIGPKPEKFAIWCDKKCVWINKDGIAGEAAPGTEGSSITLIQSSQGLIPISGQLVANEKWLANIVAIVKELKKLPVRILNFSVDDRLNEFMASAVGGQKLIFSLRFEPSEKLFASLKDLISSGDFQTAKYIDFAVENRIYHKQK